MVGKGEKGGGSVISEGEQPSDSEVISMPCGDDMLFLDLDSRSKLITSREKFC
jgi:hypothetical protein